MQISSFRRIGLPTTTAAVLMVAGVVGCGYESAIGQQDWDAGWRGTAVGGRGGSAGRGGFGGSPPSNDCLRLGSEVPGFPFTATSCSSSPVRLPDRRVLMSGATSPDGTIYLFGGQPSREEPLSCRAPLTSYDSATGRYQPLASAPISLESIPAVVFASGALIALDRDLLLYNPATDSWRPGASPPRILVDRAATVAPDGRVYFVGGVPRGGDGRGDQVDAYDPVTDSWSSLPSLPFLWQWGAAVTAGGRVYAVSLQTAVFDPATRQWTQLPPAPTGRYNLGAGVDPQGRIVTFGGYASGGPQTNVVEIFDPVAGSWSTGAPMPVPTSMFARASGCGGLLFAFGGESTDFHYIDVVQVYSPGNGTWRRSPP